MRRQEARSTRAETTQREEASQFFWPVYFLRKLVFYMPGKSCTTCVSRFICPNNYHACAGHDDERLFWSLLALNVPQVDWEKRAEFIKSLQKEAQHDN